MYIIIILSCCSALHWNETKRNRRYTVIYLLTSRRMPLKKNKSLIHSWAAISFHTYYITVGCCCIHILWSSTQFTLFTTFSRHRYPDTPLCRTLGKPPAWLLFVNLKTHTRTHSRDTILTHIYTAREMMRGKIQYNTGARERAVARSYLTSVVRTLLLRPR